MVNGFGFSFPNNNNDDGDDDRNNGNNGGNPFGGFGGFSFGFPPGAGGPGGGGGNAGGLGDMLNQFGAMLSNMGSSMNSSEGSGPVNFELTQRIASQKISKAKPVSPDDARAVEEAARLAELWIDDATALPTSSSSVKTWNAKDWLEATLPMWKRFVTPVAQHMHEAQLHSMPEEAREMMGPMANIMASMSGMNFGMQLGNALGDLAQQALTGSDFGLPVAPAGVSALLPHNIQAIARDLNVPGQEVLVYIAAREIARQRLFVHVPWLVERIVSSVEEYAIGLEIDTSHIEEATRELNLESGDPAAIQDALSKLQGMDLSPRITSRNAAAVTRLETLLALVEGWVEQVVNEALEPRLPSTVAMAEAWRTRRNSGGSAEHAFAQVVGIEFGAPDVDAAAELWRRATVAVGAKRRDQVWDHPDFLPNAEHLSNPAAFIDSLLDDAPSDNFDAEFAKLEEMLRSGESESDNQESENRTSDSREGDSHENDNPKGDSREGDSREDK